MTISALRKYDLTQSPLYMVLSKKKLAEKLNLSSPAELLALTRLEEPYRKFDVEGKSKPRAVQMPSRQLYPVHVHIFKLLRRIELPVYLHSGISGRSYITNAKAHLGTSKTYTVDLKKFYPSVSRSMVYTFFRDTMKCSEDVAGILANISTCDGHIPTGSSLSQLLAYMACKNMFDEIHSACIEAGIVMTCYVDDLTFSGDAVTRAWIYGSIKPIISRYGLKSHKDKFFGVGQPKEITGVIVDGNEVKVCNRHHRSIYDLIQKIPDADDTTNLNKIYDELIGKLSSAAQIDHAFKTKKLAAIRKRRELKPEI